MNTDFEFNQNLYLSFCDFPFAIKLRLIESFFCNKSGTKNIKCEIVVGVKNVSPLRGTNFTFGVALNS